MLFPATHRVSGEVAHDTPYNRRRSSYRHRASDPWLRTRRSGPPLSQSHMEPSLSCGGPFKPNRRSETCTRKRGWLYGLASTPAKESARATATPVLGGFPHPLRPQSGRTLFDQWRRVCQAVEVCGAGDVGYSRRLQRCRSRLAIRTHDDSSLPHMNAVRRVSRVSYGDGNFLSPIRPASSCSFS